MLSFKDKERTTSKTEEQKNFTAIYHEPGDAWTTLAPRVELMAFFDLSANETLRIDEFLFGI